MEFDLHMESAHLQAIEVFNFKSYQGKHVIGPMTELTAIMGPNGSGKSNLMDAISFALVIKSNKLRAKNVSNLVNNSSTPNGDFVLAYVKLVFKLKPQLKNLSLQRNICKDNSTEYLMDDTKISKDQYVRILNQFGFNVKNKIFLIFQGTIDKLITKNPKDFTTILEELSGSVEYKDSYDQLKVSHICNLVFSYIYLNFRRNIMKKKRNFMDLPELKGSV